MQVVLSTVALPGPIGNAEVQTMQTGRSPMPTLSVSAYVVLGLLGRHGVATPYQLDQWIRASIGYFWAFPRSQLYAEAARLVRHGLVVEEREDTGRRRRSLSITQAGRTEFARWLATPTGAPTEIRDEGLLRLFFHPGGQDTDPDPAVRRLAGEQEQAHRTRLVEFERLVASGRLHEGSPQRATLELGLRFERIAVEFWVEVAQAPPGQASGAALHPVGVGDRVSLR